MAVNKLTDGFVRKAAVPEGAAKPYLIHWDVEVTGFGLRVTRAGARSFVVNYRIGSRERRYTIGSYPDWSVHAAREEAKRLKREIDRGQDPMGERHDYREAPTVEELARRFLDEHASKKRLTTCEEYRALIEKLIAPNLAVKPRQLPSGLHRIDKLKVQDVQFSDIDKLHRLISKTAPYRANRTLAVLGKMFSLAIKWKMRSDSPCKGVERNHEDKRTRYLSADELRRLTVAMHNFPNQQHANAIRLLLLTGARRNEILSARWEMFDLKLGCWTKPSAHTKQKKEHRIPLSAPALQLLTTMHENSDSEFLFPGRKGRPQAELRRSWRQICKSASIVDVRIHDLRHTYASILASAGLSLPVIGALLGHTQATTTQRYSHLFDDPLRQATERVGTFVSAIQNKSSGEVIQIHKERSG